MNLISVLGLTIALTGQVDGTLEEPVLNRIENPTSLEQQPIAIRAPKRIQEDTNRPRTLRSDSSRRARRWSSSDLMRPEAKKAISATAVAIGVLLLFVVFSRMVAKGRGASSEQLVEVLGRTSVTPKHHLHVVRVGKKILLLTETQNGLQILDKIEDEKQFDQILNDASDDVIDDQDRDRILGLIKNRQSFDSPSRTTKKSYVA